MIYIYNGPGISEESLIHTEHTLKSLIAEHYIIKKIGPSEVNHGGWMKDAVLFVMPGGADILYVKYLTPIGNKRIKTFVEKGGSYLGLCAGAYYASTEVEFALHSPLQVIGERDLKFFPGKAIGPTLATYEYNSNSGARAAVLRWDFPGGAFPVGKIFIAYYNGGGHFENAHRYKNVKILAQYFASSEGVDAENKPAIVEIAVEKGKVILSGVHCEYDPNLLSDADQYLRPIKEILKYENEGRIALMLDLLVRLGISVNKR